MDIHDGHRERLRQRCEKNGLDSLAPHEVLELLLTYPLPRKDTNHLGHALVNRFGSLSAVMDAPKDSLCQVPGIGATSAFFLTMLPELCRLYMLDKNTNVVFDSTESCGNYFVNHFIGRTEEHVFLACLDAKNRLINCTLLHTGNFNSASLDTQLVTKIALQSNAVFLVLAHNHPNGVALPSAEDISATKSLARTLAGLQLRLLDHIIVADRDYVSLADSNALAGDVF